MIRKVVVACFTGKDLKFRIENIDDSIILVSGMGDFTFCTEEEAVAFQNWMIGRIEAENPDETDRVSSDMNRWWWREEFLLRDMTGRDHVKARPGGWW